MKGVKDPCQAQRKFCDKCFANLVAIVITFSDLWHVAALSTFDHHFTMPAGPREKRLKN